jgi:hypothetical protein
VIYLEYAWSLFFKKDQLETKLLIDPKLQQPVLSHNKTGYVIVLPEPLVHEEEISFLGYQFSSDSTGKLQAAKLFKGCVFHLSAHAAVSNFEVYSTWTKRKNDDLAKFVRSLIEDVKVLAYILAWYPDKLTDIAFANSLAFKRIKPLGKILNPATRIMAALLLQTNLGIVKGNLKMEEQRMVAQIMSKLKQFKNSILEFFAEEKVNVDELGLKIADEIYNALDRYGPIVGVPSFPHTEKLGHCTLFPQYKVKSEDEIQEIFKRSLTTLGGDESKDEFQETMWKKAAEAEALQVFDARSREKAKEETILSRYKELISSTRFKSIGFPAEDYTEYLRAKAKTKSETRRLIDSLMVAFDALDEDPRKLFGVLDLQDIIQVMASRSPRLDVFMREENISKSYAWIILLDASRSARAIGDDVRNLGICLAETAKELLIDSTSWGLYAFNDRFLILKDLMERYGPKVKARIGGLHFNGLTYMPDALQLAGELLKNRAENLRLITIISDGWPYGYSKIAVALRETLEFLEKADIAVIGVGVKSNRMENFFRVHCNVRCMRELTKKFSNLFLETGRGVVGL